MHNPQIEVAAHLQPIAMASAGTPARRVKLLPMGRIDMRDGRGPFMLRDRAHAEQVVAATRQWLGGADFNWDYNHQILKAGSAAKASGWTKKEGLSVEADGIYAEVEWTTAAAAAIVSREYRYISPLFAAAKGSGEVLYLKNSALVNVGAIDLPSVAASLRMGMKFDDAGAARPLTVEELKGLAAGDPADLLMALTEEEQFHARKLGIDFSTYLQAKIRQMEDTGEGTVAAGLTKDEADVCARLGLSHEDFLASKLDVSSDVAASMIAAGKPTSSVAPLTAAELKVCALLGLPPEQYQAAR